MKQLYSPAFSALFCFVSFFSFSQSPKLKVLWTKRSLAATLTYTPDGKKLVSGGSTLNAPYSAGQIRLWNAADGTLLTDITDNQLLGIARDVVVSPDGSRILSAAGNTICDEDCYAEKAGLFSYSLSGTLEEYLPTNSRNSYAIAVSPDGQIYASAYWTGPNAGFFLYDTAFNLVRTLTPSSYEIYDIAFTPDGKKILRSNAGGNISVYDVATGNLLVSMEHGRFEEGGNQLYIDVSPDGKYVVSSGNGSNNKVKVWRIADGAMMYSLDTHLGSGLNYAKAKFSPDGKYIVAGLIYYSDDSGRLLAWNFSNGSEIASFAPPLGSGSYGGITDIAFSSIQNNGRYYFSFASNDYITKSVALTTAMITPGTGAADRTMPVVKAMSSATDAVTVANNPFHDQIILRFGAALKGKVNIRLSDMTGRVLLQQNATVSSPQTLSVSTGNLSLTRGIYVLSVSSEGCVYQTKLLHE